MHIIATAGHVDHGKSTLVRALTGTDPDRLREEKERGLTIDLGFAFTELPSGRQISFIDVPGHIRFLKNMLAGVGSVDACIFVVAAPEGWKPQSEEHLRILELLGITHGIVVLTQTGLVDEETIEIAKMDVEERTIGTFLESAPIICVDSISRNGLDSLLLAIDNMTETAPSAPDVKRPRLWIDRAFAAVGAGSIVTGTLTGGKLRVDDELTLSPGDLKARIRGIQTQGQKRTKIGPGHRVALNLAGIDHHHLSRGVALINDEKWHRTNRIDAELTVLKNLGHDISRRGAYAIYIGSGEWAVKLRVLGPSELTPGMTGNVRIFLPSKLSLMPGDRFILREFGRDETVGGGIILDVDPQLKASESAPDLTTDRVISERKWVKADELERLTGEKRDPILGNWIALPETIEQLRLTVYELVDKAGATGLDIAQLDERQRLILPTLSDITVADGRARQAELANVLDNHPIISQLQNNLFSPELPDDFHRDELRQLVQKGLVIQSEGIFFSASAIDLAATLLANLFSSKPQGVTVAEIRDALGTTRKFALPLCAHFDRTGITRRRDDLRLPGPRLPNF
ncbi:MAG: selenocysteine-specific elongation factor [Candidatus Poriferisodalaceae bacterium]|jgi:selenocysteine-specific elongation factor|tara:strand:+ start:2224 stop:3942 length:1719 start_codon:yes stop_codon:yes gene_type:complete